MLDHVAVEVGFIADLRLKQTYALANSDPEHAATAAEAAQNFIAPTPPAGQLPIRASHY